MESCQKQFKILKEDKSDYQQPYKRGKRDQNGKLSIIFHGF